jgi:hypothetical protein
VVDTLRAAVAHAREDETEDDDGVDAVVDIESEAVAPPATPAAPAAPAAAAAPAPTLYELGMQALPTLPRTRALAVMEATDQMRTRMYAFLNGLREQGVHTVTREARPRPRPPPRHDADVA